MRDVTIRPRRSVLLLQAAIAGSLLGSYAVTASAQESSATD